MNHQRMLQLEKDRLFCLILVYTQVIQSDNRYRQEPTGSVSDSNRNPMKSDGNLINRQNPIGFLVEIRHLDPWGRI